MFLKFMLVWLISANQVVILCDSYDTHLFYRGEVYSQSAEAGFKGIPTHRSMAYCPIWTLIDVDYKNKGPRISSDLYIWPIQATSPNLNRWKAWLKQNRATLLGMPLWNVEELMRGYAFSLFSLLSSASTMSFDRGSSLTSLPLCYSLPLTPEYDDFRSKLEKSLPLPDGSTLYTTDGKVESPNTSNNAINAALGILREREKVVEAEKNEDLDSMGDGFRSSATDRDEDMVDATGNKDTVDETGDEGMVDEAGQPPAPVDTVDNALEILVHNAIEEFGLAPRDVYSGLFEPRSTGRLHDNAVRDLDYTEMQKTVRFFSTKCGLDSATSHHLIVVFPRPHPTDSLLEHDRWAVDFKSIRIARKVTELMRLQNIERLWEMYQSFHRNPQSSTLAGWVFEAIVHRLLSGGCQSGPVLRPIRTDHNGSSDSPVFYTDPSPPTPDTSSSGPLRLRTRAVTGVNFTDCRLSDMTLKNGRYYIPTAAIRPLFDSFTIDVDSHTVVISLFRITISPRNEGLAEGYPHVRKIAVYANF